MNRLTGIAAVAALLALSACGKADKAQGAGKAEGEILPGSTSDAMIPVDQVRSQPPLAPKADGSDKPEDKGKPTAKAAKPASDAATDEAPADEPATVEQ